MLRWIYCVHAPCFACNHPDVLSEYMCCFIDCFGSLGLDSSQCLLLLLLLSFMVCVDVRFLFSLNPQKNCCWLSGTNCGCTWQLPGVRSFKSSKYAPNQTVDWRVKQFQTSTLTEMTQTAVTVV